MNQQQFNAITQWQKKTFGKATTLSIIAHLEDEVGELTVDLVENAPVTNKHLEFADCFILLFGAAANEGMSYEDICNAIDEKMVINYKRKWSNPNDKGIVKHIR